MSEKPNQTQTKEAPSVGLSFDQLKELLAEARKPAGPTERELREIAEMQAGRAEVAKSVVAEIEGKRAFQRMCSHHHIKGDSHGVYIQDGNYILCQKCVGKIRPDDGVKADKNSIYDTALFNRMFQEANQTDM